MARLIRYFSISLLGLLVFQVFLYATILYGTASLGCLVSKNAIDSTTALLPHSEFSPVTFQEQWLLAVVPFTELSNLRNLLFTWETHPPCQRNKSSASLQTSLLFYYSHDLEKETDLFRALIQEVQEHSSIIDGCFEKVIYRSAELSGERDLYDKSRKDHKWVRGPNELFFSLMLDSEIRQQFYYVAWLETDTVPVRLDWIAEIHNAIAAAPIQFWVIGSKFHGACLPNADFQTCTVLEEAIADHINGNAIYAVGLLEFYNVLKNIHTGVEGELQYWPFDLAIFLYVKRLPYTDYAQRYIYSDIIRNYGLYPFETNRLPKDVYLVHGTNPDFIFGGRNMAIIHDGKAGSLPSRQSQKASHLEGLPYDDKMDATVGVSQIDPDLELLLKNHANPKKQVVITFLSWNYIELFKNFLHHVKQAGMKDSLLVITYDAESTQWLEEQQVGAYRFPLTIRIKGSDAYNSEGFRSVVSRRSQILEVIHRIGTYHILMTDLDAFWMRDPLEYFWEHSWDYDFQIQVDDEVGTAEDDPSAGFDHFFNFGVHYAVTSKRTYDFYRLLNQRLRVHGKEDDQHAFNVLLQDNALDLRIRSLDNSLFPNGFVHYRRALPDVEPFLVHNNWVNGIKTKRYQFRERGLWVTDDEDYFSKTNRKYIYYEDQIENNGLNNQRVALRHALQIAEVLNRTLILPAFYMYHKANLTTTFDSFFDYEAFSHHFPNHREHSFMKRVFPCPEKVFFIETSEAGEKQKNPGMKYDFVEGCPPDHRVKEIAINAPRHFLGMGEDEIKQWLEPYQREPVLVFNRLFRRFYRFSNMEKQDEFNNRMMVGLQPESTIVQIAQTIVSRLKSNSSSFNCLHVRRRDFLLYHKSTEQGVHEIAAIAVKKLPEDIVLFLATDDVEDVLPAMQEKFSKVYTLLDGNIFPSRYRREFMDAFEGALPMHAGYVEQLVCSNAAEFVGNLYSTFSMHICALREQRGLKVPCVDIYDRQKHHEQMYE